MDSGKPATIANAALESGKLALVEQRRLDGIEVVGAVDGGNEDYGFVLGKVRGRGERRSG